MIYNYIIIQQVRKDLRLVYASVAYLIACLGKTRDKNRNQALNKILGKKACLIEGSPPNLVVSDFF